MGSGFNLFENYLNRIYKGILSVILLTGLFAIFTIKANDSQANSVVIDNNNNIVVGGFFTNGSNLDFCLARYLNNGLLDTANFNPNGPQPGVVVTDLNGGDDIINWLTIDNNNKIVAIGSSSNAQTSTTTSGEITSDVAVARYNPDGSLDTTFNPQPLFANGPRQGIILTDVRNNIDVANSGLIDNNNKILVAGYSDFAQERNFFKDILLIRYNNDGSLDTSFNPNNIQPNGSNVVVSGSPGILILNFSATAPIASPNFRTIANSVTLDNNNKILVAGSIIDTSQNSANADANILIVRLNPDGTLDQTFNSNLMQPGKPGYVIINILDQEDAAFDIKVDNNNKIVIAGTSSNGITGGGPGQKSDIVIARLNPDGTFDTTFNPQGSLSPVSGNKPGLIITDFSTSIEQANIAVANSLAIDNNNNIVITGYLTNQSSNTSILTIRYNSNGIDQTFNANSTPGFIITEIPNSQILFGTNDNAQGNFVVIDNNNKVVVTGFSFDGTQNNVTTVRYNPDGTLDTAVFNSTGIISGISGVVITVITNGQEAPFQGPVMYYTSLLPYLKANPQILSEISSEFVGFWPPTITAPINGNIFNEPILTISGTAKPNCNVSVLVDGISVDSVNADYTGHWLITAGSFEEGTHSIQAVATDFLSNLTLSSHKISVIINTQLPPAPSISIPLDSSFIETSTIDISGKAEHNSHVSILINNILLDSVVANSSGLWTYKTPVLPDGVYILSAAARNLSGNMLNESNKISVNINTKQIVPPVILKPINNTKINNSETILEGSSQPYANILIYLNDQELASIKSDSKGRWSYKIVNLTSNTHRIYAASYYPVKNIKKLSSEITLTVDTEIKEQPILSSLESLITKSKATGPVSIFIDGNYIGQTNLNEKELWKINIPHDLSKGTHTIAISKSDIANKPNLIIKKTFNIG